MISKAVILAAGRGMRLGKLTENVPKPMVPVAGVPMLTRILQSLETAGIRSVCIVAGYKSRQIIGAYGSGRELGLQIGYEIQSNPDGTGSAALLAEEFVGEEPFVLCFGDILLHPEEHYAKLLETFIYDRPAAVVTCNRTVDSSSGASVAFDSTGQVTSIIEKPPAGADISSYNQSGCFVFTPDVFRHLHEIGPSERGEIELTSAIAAMINNRQKVLAYPVAEEDWLDIGTPDTLAAAEVTLQIENE